MALIVPIAGSTPSVPASAWVAPNATLVGSVTLGESASVFYGAVLRADVDTITLGAGSNIQDNVVVHCDAGKPTTIGANVSVGHAAVLHGCTIEDGVLIGMGATVLNNAVIGANSLVGAGALVTEGKVFPPGSLIVGVPARAVRTLTPEQIAGLKLSAAAYRARGASFAAGLRRVD